VEALPVVIPESKHHGLDVLGSDVANDGPFYVLVGDTILVYVQPVPFLAATS
jgi:hypothetical protein